MMWNRLILCVISVITGPGTNYSANGYVASQDTPLPGPTTLVVVMKEHVFKARRPKDPRREELPMRKGRPSQYELEAGRDWVVCENGGEIGVLGIIPMIYTDVDGYKPIPSITREEAKLIGRDNAVLTAWLLGRVGALVSNSGVGKGRANTPFDTELLQKCEGWLSDNPNKGHKIRYRLARAVVFLRYRRYERATNEIKKALELDPENPYLKKLAREIR